MKLGGIVERHAENVGPVGLHVRLLVEVGMRKREPVGGAALKRSRPVGEELLGRREAGSSNPLEQGHGRGVVVHEKIEVAARAAACPGLRGGGATPGWQFP